MELAIVFEFFTLFCIGFLGALTPGPDILFTLRNTLNHGIMAGFLSLFGIFLGWITFLSLIYFGFTHFISGILVQGLLNMLGGIYLSYVAYLLLKEKPILNPKITLTQSHTINKSSYLIVFRGFLLNLSNPKAILFFGVIITPFMQNFLIISLSILLLSLISAFILVILLATFFRHFINDSLFYKIDKICGFLFLFFAFFLFLESYHKFVSLMINI